LLQRGVNYTDEKSNEDNAGGALNSTAEEATTIIKVKKSCYRPGVAQKVPEN
jgi:hypothetical protein